MAHKQRKSEDLVGQKFHHLTPVRRVDEHKRKVYWECLCDCGKTTTVHSGYLKTGVTKSCGHLKLQGNNLRHGMTDTKEYRIWRNMINRCRNQNVKEFKHYGGRGITIAPEFSSFESFYSIMGPRPQGMTLERNDVNGNYSESNCRWATMKEQARNKRVSRFITYNGETKCLAAWAEVTGLRASLILSRIDYLGWNTGDALTTPVVPSTERWKWRGKEQQCRSIPR